MKASFIKHLEKQTEHRNFHIKHLIAAALKPIIIVAGVLLFVANQHGVLSNNTYAELTIPTGEQAHVVLSDGTRVHLNSGSTLHYPKTFGIFERKVKLEGEGYFEVAKEKARRFVVCCNEVTITVTGTKFNAKNYQNEDRITVSLEEGSVNIKDENSELYSLCVAQRFDYNKKTDKGTVSNVENISKYMAWRTNGIDFYRTSFDEIIKELERRHDLHFIVSDTSLFNYKFSISTNKVNINEVLADFEKVSNLKFVQEGEKCFQVISK
jgi:ferric-dicitrate binding protein FerR (iron transport regulator)